MPANNLSVVFRASESSMSRRTRDIYDILQHEDRERSVSRLSLGWRGLGQVARGMILLEVSIFVFKDRGASVAELIVLTGWLPHTTRAALTGLRKRGFVTAIDRSDKKRGSIYRVEKSPTTEDSAAAHYDGAQTGGAPPSKTVRREAKPKTRCAA
jgi:Protein of unknown function (DUF3489)